MGDKKKEGHALTIWFDPVMWGVLNSFAKALKMGVGSFVKQVLYDNFRSAFMNIDPDYKLRLHNKEDDE